jgi:Ca2+-binding EF-hand superfamily protein
MSTVENTSAWAQTLSSISTALSGHLQDKMLKKMDTDGSGGVDQTEFKAALEKVASKLGIEVGEGSEALYASLDADQDGSLNGTEVGQLLRNLFAPPTDTQAFVQSRGDEARFTELDADGDGSISMAEFGIVPNAGLPEGTVVSSTTTTTTTTTVVQGADSPLSPMAGADAAVAALTNAAPATPSGTVAASPVAAEEATDEATNATEVAAADTDDRMSALMKAVDKDGNGDISGAELTAFLKLVNTQAEAATRRYNETALAGRSPQGSLNETA